MVDIAEAAEKKLKSRIRELKKCNNNAEKKENFFNQLGLTFNISLPNKNPEKQDDMIVLYANSDGNVVYAVYEYSEENQFSEKDISEKDLKVIIEAFKNFKLKLLK